VRDEIPRVIEGERSGGKTKGEGACVVQLSRKEQTTLALRGIKESRRKLKIKKNLHSPWKFKEGYFDIKWSLLEQKKENGEEEKEKIFSLKFRRENRIPPEGVKLHCQKTAIE